MRTMSSRPSKQWPRTSSSELHRNRQLVDGQVVRLCPQDGQLTKGVLIANVREAPPITRQARVYYNPQFTIETLSWPKGCIFSVQRARANSQSGQIALAYLL